MCHKNQVKVINKYGSREILKNQGKLSVLSREAYLWGW